MINLILVLSLVGLYPVEPSPTEKLSGELRPENPKPVLKFERLPRQFRLAKHCPASTDSVIKEDFLINDDLSGGCAQRAPEIVVGSDGRFIITWYEFRDGDADVWFQRFDSTGNPLGINERVNDDVTFGWQGDPAAVIVPDGSFIFTWEDRRQIGNSDVFAQRFSSEGIRLGDNFRVSDSSASGDQSISAVHIAPDGTALVVWDDRRNGLTGDIYGQFLNPDGSLRGYNFRINDDPINYGNQYEPDVAGDDSGRFVVVWEDGRDGNWSIYGQRFLTDGTPLGRNFRISNNDSNQFSPKIAVTPAGDFMVCWNDRGRGQWDVYAQIFNRNGSPIDTNFRVNTDTGIAQQLLGDVAVNRFNEFIVVWSDNRNGNDDIYAQRFDVRGSRLGTALKINDDNTDKPQNSPSVSAAPDGGYWIAWADARSGDYDIYCQRLERGGNKVGVNFRVNDDFASALQRCSSIGREKNRRLLIAWEDERNTNCDIYGAVIDENGNLLQPNFRLNDDPLNANSHYYPAVAGGNNRFLIAWVDSRQGWDIYAQYVSASGEKIGNNFLVNTGAISAHQWYPYCAMDTYNRSVIVWCERRGGTSKIYARLYNENGNPLTSEFRVGDTPDTLFDELYASTAKNSDGYWVTAWMDYRNGNSDIYCQLFTPEGSPIGSNILVNTDGQGAYQGYPSCAIDDNRNIAIAWEDTRNGTYDVYLQWLDSLGQRLGNNERVNDNPPGETYCYSPSCAFDQNGRLAVMFNDERETPDNPQIYCQRFNSDCSRISFNKKINQPNYFPKNTHWTVGQSVAADTQIIAFTWTDNRRHKGWDIFAKITDWNLIGISEPTVATNTIKNTLHQPFPVILMKKSLQIKKMCGANLTISDASGRRLYLTKIDTDHFRLNLNRLPSGIYFLTIQNGEKILTHKFLLL